MAPRKRRQRKKVNTKKCQNLQETPETDIADGQDIYLSLLPDEILLFIYSFLSPVDLSSLSELKNQRLTDLTYTVREANVSSCRKNNPLLVSTFFNSIRMKYIQKLNFNYYFYIRPHELTNLISQCKNLTILSVVECGLKYNNIVNILQSCVKLEDLAWNVREVRNDLNICCPKMKRVYLFLDIKELSSNSVVSTVRNFPNIENLWINFGQDSISALPFIGLWLKSSCISNSKLAKQFTLTTNSLQGIPIATGEVFMMEMVRRDFLRGNDGLVDPSDVVRSIVFNNPPYLQIKSIKENIALLSAGPFNAYSTIKIILTSEIISVSESLIKCIKDLAGNKLMHLSLHCDAQFVDRSDNPLPIADEEAIATCDMLDQMFLTSKNITVLNLTTVHFNKGSPIKAITQLPNLRVLNIPSCAFGSSAKLAHFQSFELANVVSSCPKVEDFALNCCINDSEQLSEDDIVCIKDWSLLKHLSIYSIVLHTCKFLKKVADSCVNLQSLSLISVAHRNVCLFTNDVIYVLKKAQNLRFIRINEEKFNPAYEPFWDAIGEAVNLEGICIITQSKCHVHTQTVIKGIKKLKYLHLFHFFAPRISDSLFLEAKCSMEEHGVKNIKIENICISNRICLSPKISCYYHEQPQFSCQLLHLKDIDIF